MRATVVVHLQSDPAQALRCLTALAELPAEPEHEVIVVDDASTGLDDLLLRLDGDVKIVRTGARSGLARSLARASSHAGGDVLVVLRGAVEVGTGWLEPLLTALDDPGVVAATSATEGDGRHHQATAHAVAARREDLDQAGIPDVPDDAAIAAICIELCAGGGRAVTVAQSVVRPAVRSGGARRAPGEDPELSIVIPTLDATCGRVQRCVGAVQRTTEVPYELILVDNGAPPQGFTAPVNSGIRAARGDYVVVMNDDVETLPGWWEPLRRALDAGALVSFPVTAGGAVRRDFSAWCFAVSRASLELLAHSERDFFDPAYCVWFQDTDLMVQVARNGSRPVCVEESTIRHGHSETVDTADPELRAWIDARIAEDHEHFSAKHPDVPLTPAEFERGAQVA